eukprot:CAMPEP_0180168660 /NCGR_PEP_ID=MMETSP0986-20121125/32801_1 /TAXON_ID=697907 /ORGANISM="non described non described, Strain CCMP2293" /LENGTH=231 /DNA_ID=CAMNT_0022120077 /DNA_START=6 /DNA_END=697 /DNA_ORIENTATION=-
MAEGDEAMPPTSPLKAFANLAGGTAGMPMLLGSPSPPLAPSSPVTAGSKRGLAELSKGDGTEDSPGECATHPRSQPQPRGSLVPKAVKSMPTTEHDAWEEGSNLQACGSPSPPPEYREQSPPAMLCAAPSAVPSSTAAARVDVVVVDEVQAAQSAALCPEPLSTNESAPRPFTQRRLPPTVKTSSAAPPLSNAVALALRGLEEPQSPTAAASARPGLPSAFAAAEERRQAG